MVRLLLMLAVLLMPLGMAPVAAQEASNHDMGMMMQHCPEPAGTHHKDAFAECTMACSAALPAAEFARDEVVPGPCEPVAPTAQPVLHGVHPETATPPPKLA
jgi:hypothetical protein